ncbi:MAG: beta-galactosidase, partial [Microbacterium sp.]
MTAVETYVAWNFHERRPGVRSFSGWRDLPRFIGLAADAGLEVIVRPSPYICAEWDAGGLPSWLRETERVPLRTADPRFLSAVAAWYDDLIPRLVPLQRTNGGPIVSMQVENEYGSYADDHDYME